MKTNIKNPLNLLEQRQGKDTKLNSFKVDFDIDIPDDGENVEMLKQKLQSDIPKQDYEKVVYNAVELMALGNLQPKYLMFPIFPQLGTAFLAGKPDTGKSQLARHFCIQVALGEKTFLDFDLNLVHKSAIYVTTEDGLESTKYLVSKQFEGLGRKEVENLRFIIADVMEQKEIIVELKKQLKISPVDLVVVDSFGDIFQGNDSNNNMMMRNTVKLFDKIAKKFNCLVLFVHHINKKAYRQSPGQEHIQGGSGLMQKTRLAVQLSEGDGDIRYFTVVKGNYCPKKFKQNSIKLIFSEENFLFTNTGIMIPTSEIGTQPSTSRKKEKNNKLEKTVQAIISDQLMSHTDFKKQFCDITGKSDSSASRALKKLTNSGFIEKYQDKYHIKSIEDNEEIDT